MSDIIDVLVGTDHRNLSELRDLRPDAKKNAQKSFEALLEPADPGTFTYVERYAVAAYVAGLHQFAPAVEFYADLLEDDAPESLVDAVRGAVTAGISTGPYGVFREPGVVERSEQGGSVRNDADALGGRLAAAFDYAHLLVFHPRDSRPEVLGGLSAVGWTADEMVSLGQLVSFLTFQLRVAYALRTLLGEDVQVQGTSRAVGEDVEWALSDEGFPITTYDAIVRPERFVNHALGWKPWVPPVPKADLTQAQMESLIKPERADMPYFRLLARDPDALKARTLTDLDIFFNTDGGLGRAERELGATVTSIYNGCVYCASVHAGRAVEESGRADDVNRLIDDGLDVDLGSDQWDVIRDASRELTATPPRFNQGCVAKLRSVGFEDSAIVDLINSVAFFNWANRLMLSLGEPDVPRRFQ